MSTPTRRLAAIVRLTAATLVALAVATPASAQFGGLKKKLKSAAGQEAASKGVEAAAPAAPAEAAGAAEPAGNGGMIVLTEEVVGQLVAGLKAGKAEREAAAKEDTPYGRYQRAQAAYTEAKAKCDAAQQTYPTRLAADQKLMDKANALIEKMSAAQAKGDQKLTAEYTDEALALVDPSCTVKQPTQPDDYFEAQRDIDSRAEQQEMKGSGLTRSELAMVKERAEAILRGATPPGDASPAEKNAVEARSAELKRLMGMEQPVRERKAAPPPAAPAPVAPAAPTVSPEASKMNDCIAKNAQAHQAELEALAKRAEAAHAAGDTQKVMAIADTLRQIQMAGCQ